MSKPRPTIEQHQDWGFMLAIVRNALMTWETSELQRAYPKSHPAVKRAQTIINKLDELRLDSKLDNDGIQLRWKGHPDGRFVYDYQPQFDDEDLKLFREFLRKLYSRRDRR
jgi:hypothetical protein